jgi:hypothetical protein
VSLDSRLLAACNVAYFADAGFAGPLTDETPYTKLVGFLEPPHILVGGDFGINSALVGRIAEGVLITFRGTIGFDDTTRTESQRVLDWAQDFHATMIDRGDMPGLVHSGFSAALDSLSDQVDEFVDGRRCLFAGHSKGAALATLAAYRYSKRCSRPTVCTTFGGPRVGDAAFAKAFADSPVSLVRYEAAGDLVPRTPLDLRAAEILANSLGVEFPHADYCPVGQLLFIENDGGVKRPMGIAESAVVECESLFDVGARFISGGGASGIRRSHSIEEGSLYWRALNSQTKGAAA